jgi:hypothetical protein
MKYSYFFFQTDLDLDLTLRIYGVGGDVQMLLRFSVSNFEPFSIRYFCAGNVNSQNNCPSWNQVLKGNMRCKNRSNRKQSD